jgi:hypothetical protein
MRKESILSEGTYLGFEWKVLHNGLGFRCGYIYIPKDHPWFEKQYDDIPADVHGGLTYSQFDDLIPDKWCIGFDCAHLGDKQDLTLPHTVPINLFEEDTIKTLPFVEKECLSLCEQASEAVLE